MRLSTHFDSGEFRDASTGKEVSPEPRLLWLLEATRRYTGRPIRITSFYRSESHQRQLYTVLRSADRSKGRRPRPYVVGYHPKRLAVDVRRGDVTVEQALACGWTGIGRSGRWAVHLDARPGARPVIFDDAADG